MSLCRFVKPGQDGGRFLRIGLGFGCLLRLVSATVDTASELTMST
jgi:hypothetical protein